MEIDTLQSWAPSPAHDLEHRDSACCRCTTGRLASASSTRLCHILQLIMKCHKIALFLSFATFFRTTMVVVTKSKTTPLEEYFFTIGTYFLKAHRHAWARRGQDRRHRTGVNMCVHTFHSSTGLPSSCHRRRLSFCLRRYHTMVCVLRERVRA